MAKAMRKLAKWHIWLGWLVGVPILMWTATGLFMVAKPIEEVRGNHLRIGEDTPQPLVIEGSALATADQQIKDMRLTMQDGRAVAILTTMDDVVTRVDYTTGEPLEPLSGEDARARVAEWIKGGDKVRSVTFFDADEVPFDFRRPIPVWRVALENGAYIYVGRDSGAIEAVRTRWWRWFDVMWGLHIMDLQTRELDQQSPFNYAVLVFFAALAVIGALLGTILMFRRRKAKVKVKTKPKAARLA